MAVHLASLYIELSVWGWISHSLWPALPPPSEMASCWQHRPEYHLLNGGCYWCSICLSWSPLSQGPHQIHHPCLLKHSASWHEKKMHMYLLSPVVHYTNGNTAQIAKYWLTMKPSTKAQADTDFTLVINILKCIFIRYSGFNTCLQSTVQSRDWVFPSLKTFRGTVRDANRHQLSTPSILP